MSNDIHKVIDSRLKQLRDAVDYVECNYKRYIMYENHYLPQISV